MPWTASTRDPGSPRLFYRATLPVGRGAAVVAAVRSGSIFLTHDDIPGECPTRFEYRSAAALNLDTIPREVIFTAVGDAVFDLRAYIERPPSNVSPYSSRRVADGEVLRGQNPLFGVTSTCASREDAGPPDHFLYYSASIPAGQTQTITATPTAEAPWAPRITLFDDDDVHTCIATSSGAAGPPGPRSATHTNAGSAP